MIDISKYRRIYAGLGWPYAEKPGFLVVLAEEKKKDHTLPYSPRHYRVLAETETDDIEELRRYGLKYRDDFKLKTIYGDPSSPIYELWRRRYGSDVVNLALPSNHEDIDLNLLAQLVKRNTHVRKTLHFGQESRLPGHLMELMEDRVPMDYLEEYPALTALSYPLVQLELTTYQPGGHFRPDRLRSTF